MSDTPIYDQLVRKKNHKHWWTRFILWMQGPIDG